MKLLKIACELMMGFCLCLIFCGKSDAQTGTGIEVKIELCQFSLESNKTSTGEPKLKVEDWFVPLKTRTGKPGATAGMPVYLKVELTNVGTKVQTLSFKGEGNWLSLKLTRNGGSRVTPLKYLPLLTIGDGPRLSSTGGFGRNYLRPGETYREYLCLNQYYSLRRADDFHLTATFKFALIDDAKRKIILQTLPRTDGVLQHQEIVQESEIPLERKMDCAFRLWDFNRSVIEKSLAQFTSALSKTNANHSLYLLLAKGWLAFPEELSYPTWEQYINAHATSELFHAVEYSPNFVTVNLMTFIAGNENCSQVERYRALGLLQSMVGKENEIGWPELSSAVRSSLGTLEGRVPNLFLDSLSASRSDLP